MVIFNSYVSLPEGNPEYGCSGAELHRISQDSYDIVLAVLSFLGTLDPRRRGQWPFLRNRKKKLEVPIP